MRRIRCILAAVFLLLCCGCQNASPETDDTPLPAAFTAKIAVTHGALEFEADLTVSADGTAQTALTAPEAVASLSITQNADGCRFSFLGLTLETPPAFLPDASFANLLYAAVNTLRSDTADRTVAGYGNSTIYTSKTEAGDIFSLTCTQDGTPQSLSMEGQDLHVTFSDFTVSE